MLAAVLFAIAGCQADGSGGVLGFGGDSAPREKVLQSELTGYCPQVNLRAGTSYFNTYAKGGEGDPAKIRYQASISDATRSCSRSGGMLSMNVAVAGRVVPGPAGTPGTLTLPIRIAVTRGNEVLYSQLHRHPVSIGEGSGATQFILNDPNIAMPIPETGTIQIFVGYDEGPA